MKRVLTKNELVRQNVEFLGTGGRSEENAGHGFRPAFYDCGTGMIHLSRFADGRPAPLHLLEGLPDEVITQRGPEGRVLATKMSLIAGFERKGFFYTRKAAAKAMAEWGTR